MFAAIKLVELRPDLSIIMFEKGKRRHNGSSEDLDKIASGSCDDEHPDSLTEGWGGAGAVSDGKFNLDETGRVGGRLVTGGYVSRETYVRRLHEAADLYIKFGGDNKRIFGVRDEKNVDAVRRVRELQRIGAAHRIELHTFPILHLGTSTAHAIVENIRTYLTDHGVEIMEECMVQDMVHTDRGWMVQTRERGTCWAKHVIVCPGRSGATWFRAFAEAKGMLLHNNGVDIGVRVETSQVIMEELTDLLYEAKCYFRSGNDDNWRTFCMCPNGRVAMEHYQDTGIRCANGHTDPENLSDNCNFAVLGTQVFTAPFSNPLRYGQRIADLHNDLAGGEGILVQRLGDMRDQRRSTPHRIAKSMVTPTLTEEGGAIPGDIRLAMPGRFTAGLMRFFEAFDFIAPGINNPDTLLYGPEIKLHMSRVEADPTRGFEAAHHLHVAGDGAGYTRGLNGASVHGMLVAEWIAKNFGE
ncbi:MAG: FAD-dependent oxidoreductase [Candidatus Kerfeldbacteria bacterium]